MPPNAQPVPVECPRCHSLDTKFCYFNNYNLQQPRHFCRSCRRYWTLGGALRDVPVGGASRRQVGALPPHPKRRRRNPPTEELPPPQAPPPDATFAQVLEEPLAEPGGFDEFLGGGFGLDLGLGLGGMDEVGFGMGRSMWPFHGEEEAWMGGGGGCAGGGFGPAEGKELRQQ